MILQFLGLLNVLLFSRLVFVFQDELLSKNKLVLMISLQVIGLCIYQVSYVWGILAGLLILTGVLFHSLEKNTKKFNEVRLLSFSVYVAVLSIFFAPGVGLDFNAGLFSFLRTLDRYSLFFEVIQKTDWLKLNIILLGGLLNVNEVNMLLRFVLQALDLVPQKKEKPSDILLIDRREYNAGRVIGMLERIFAYIFVLNGQIGAIGFILAAKGLVRFKELEERRFAEYVLIGTLLSVLAAIVAASVVGFWLP